jgi:hypothetical protein
MAGELEGLGILHEPYSGMATEALDARDREAWRNHIGDRIMEIGASWQISGESCPESMWALRIGFAVSPIVIALGTVDPDLDYLPDELVVLSDMSLARTYHPRHVNESSWGAPIDSP